MTKKLNEELFEEVIHSMILFNPKGFYMTQLHKFLYFLEFNYLERYEEELLKEEFIKNHFGPTSKNLKKYLNILIQKGLISSYEDENGKEVYFSVKSKDYKFNNKISEELEKVKKNYSKLSASKLSDLSHKDNPYKVTEDMETINKQAVFYRTKDFSVFG